MSQTATQSTIELVPQVPREPQDNEPQSTSQTTQYDIRKSSTGIIFTVITCVTGIGALLAGLVTVALPRIALDLDLSPSLLLWPSSIYALTCGCTLILSGAIADVVGSRTMYLIGCLLQSACTLACGLAQDGFQLILFRAFGGIALAFCLPSSVSLITTYFPHGKRRNLAFAAMGGGQPAGFSIGLTLGGVLVDGPGWRYGFHISTAINTLIFIIAFFGLPKPKVPSIINWHLLWEQVDWTGAILLSTSLGLLSYVFASLTGNVSSIRSPITATLLSLALILLPIFIIWVGRQERLGRPAIIPNSLWKNQVFSSICFNVFLLWGSFNATETFLTLFFQDVQSLSAIQTSLRFLPAPVVGVMMNIGMGLAIHKFNANWIVIAALIITAIAPLLFAVMKPQDSYWEFAFPAMAFNVVGPDALFTVSNLVITSAFPDRTQALAGGVFNTIAQIGKSVGLALSAVIANDVSNRLLEENEPQSSAMLQGYRAAWWYSLAVTITTLCISIFGLRNIGKLGLKRE